MEAQSFSKATMPFQYTSLIFVLVFTIVLGAFILVDETSRNGLALLSDFLAREYVALRRSFQVSNFPGSLSKGSANILSGYGHLLFPGGIALFGALTAGLIIRNVGRISRQDDQVRSRLNDLTQAKEKAEKLSKLKSDFLNYVSHELRTPLTVTMGYIDCMADGLYGHIDTKHKQILEIVSRQASELRKMIDQILVFSRLEAEKDQVRIEEFSLSKVITEMREAYDFLANQKGIEIIWDLPGPEATFKSDSERFREILSNLVQNAIKYTDHGSVRVRVQHSPPTNSVELEVADTGIGIPRDSLANIFEPFVRAHKTASGNSAGGFGLGLSIVRKHVELLKGGIDVKSEPGKGTTFRIVLPRSYSDGIK